MFDSVCRNTMEAVILLTLWLQVQNSCKAEQKRERGCEGDFYFRVHPYKSISFPSMRRMIMSCYSCVLFEPRYEKNWSYVGITF